MQVQRQDDADIAADDATPLTEAQAGLWYAQRLDPANPIFNTGQVTELCGALDVTAFTRAVHAVMAEADGLCMVVREVEGAPMAGLDARLRPQLETIDLRAQPQARDAAMAAMRQDLATPVDLTRGPLVRQVLYRVRDDLALWYQRVHHVLIDSYGMSLIDNRVAQRYRQMLHAQPDVHRPFTPFSEVLREDQAYLGSARRERDKTYWLSVFQDAPPVASLAEGTALTAHRFHQETRALDADVSAALAACADKSGVSWPDILLTLCAAYVARHLPRQSAQEQRVVLGVPYMGRMGSIAARVPAMVMNIMPVPVVVDESMPMDEVYKKTARTLRQARRHGRYRSEQLRRDLGLLGGSRRLHGPLVNVLPFLSDEHAFPGVRANTHVLCAGPVDDLTITWRADAAGRNLDLIVEANPALYTSDQVRAHAQRLHTFVQRALVATCLRTVPTLTPEEHQRWVFEVNDTATPLVPSTLVTHLESAMRLHAQNTALQYADQTLTYAQLDRASARLARRLHDHGVQRGDIVALALPRSVELIVALLAVQRAGAAYLPLDVQHPPARLQGLLEDAKPRVLLTFTCLCDRFSDRVSCMLLDAPDGSSAWRDDAAQLGDAKSNAPADSVLADPAQAPQPDDAAYLLYTSGSTGAPKGVVVTHDAIVNRLLWMRSHYRIDAQDRILQKTPYTFDVSVWEFFLPLIAGATLVVAPPDAHRDPLHLAHLVREHRISVLHFVPSMLAAFLDEPTAAGLSPRLVFCSGEALPAALRDRLHQVMRTELHNLYGPTEAAVDVTWWPAARDDASDPVPIGFPVWNTALYVLDEAQRPVPAGVTGRLYIAGRQLARGYLGRPDLTAQRFVPDPYANDAHTRMYDTGDLACWRADGALQYMGRVDDQVKIRGQRVELGEIEAALLAAPGVRRAAVLVREDEPDTPQLVAYVVPQGHLDLEVDALRDFVATRLPDVMVPSAFVTLDDLPVTASGKLDRRALPAPQVQTRSGRSPAPGTETALATLYAQILNRTTPVSADDDFFALGGHSLLAARLAAAIREQWHMPSFSLGAVFEHSTVARLARHLDAIASQTTPDGGGFGRMIVLRAQREHAARAPLVCVHPAGGLGWCYGALARAMARPVLGLQARSLHAADADNPWPESLDAMAADYVDQLQAVAPSVQTPIHLIGWSVGGIIAHAMAVKMQRHGLPVGLLCMLDAYPSDCWRGQPEPAPEAVYKALLHIAGYDPMALSDVALERDAVVEFLRRSGHPLGELPDDRLDGVMQTVAWNNRLVRRHTHQRFDGSVLHVRADLDHQGQNLVAEHWRPYVGHIQTLGLPFLHAHMTGAAAVAQFAPCLEKHLLLLEHV